MKLLLDECLPRKLKFVFSGSGHPCETVREAGFGGKENGNYFRWRKESLTS